MRNILRINDWPKQSKRLAAALLRVAQQEARVTRGFAMLMSDAKQHELAEVLMSQAKATIARAKA